MNYLFFDVECCDGYHICSFGYVLVDSNFNVIQKDDIVINPKSKFNLSAKGKKPRIELAYSKDFFDKQKTFKYHYLKIKNLLMQENQILFGHSITSDFHFLTYACDRYDLPRMELVGYDTQIISQKILKTEHVESLEKILTALDINTEKIQLHKSCDDAYATFLIVKAICEKEEVTINELLKRYKGCKVELKNCNIKNTNKRKIEDKKKLIV